MDDASEFRFHGIDKAFENYLGRRKGIIKALTEDVNVFLSQCAKFAVMGKEHIGLYGFPSGKWQIMLDDDLAIDFPHSRLHELSKEEMNKASWLPKVAADSDIWLGYVTFFFCGCNCYDNEMREWLFNKVNELPTIYEVITGATEKAKKRGKDKSTVSCHSSKKSKLNSEVQGMSSSRLVRDLKKQRELPMQNARQTRSKALGIQTTAPTGKSLVKKTS